MRGLKTLLSSTVLLAGLVLAPAAQAQISINIGVQPVCSYGYYDYAPYACAPVGFYGPGYFYNGIFLGMGPWAGWGYGHGWGGHRFVADGGGRYHGGGGFAANRGYAGGGAARGGGGGQHAYAGSSHAPAERMSTSHASAPSHVAANGGGARPSAGRAAPTPHAAASRGGGESHGGGGEAHGGGGDGKR